MSLLLQCWKDIAWTKADTDVVCRMNLFLKCSCVSVKLLFLHRLIIQLVYETFSCQWYFAEINTSGKAILFAGNFHLVLGRVNFNLPISWVTFFFVLIYLFHYIETRGPRCTTEHVPNYVLPPYLEKWDWLLPSSETGFPGQKIYTWGLHRSVRSWNGTPEEPNIVLWLTSLYP